MHQWTIPNRIPLKEVCSNHWYEKYNDNWFAWTFIFSCGMISTKIFRLRIHVGTYRRHDWRLLAHGKHIHSINRHCKDFRWHKNNLLNWKFYRELSLNGFFFHSFLTFTNSRLLFRDTDFTSTFPLHHIYAHQRQRCLKTFDIFFLYIDSVLFVKKYF